MPMPSTTISKKKPGDLCPKCRAVLPKGNPVPVTLWDMKTWTSKTIHVFGCGKCWWYPSVKRTREARRGG